jgi:uncharacterized 2Fe-2S/4Fe-4S cluster protein (DUF4445 family)
MPEKNRLCIGGGNCEECGRCNLYDTTTRKKRLTNLPEDFVPDKPESDGQDHTYGIAFDIGTTTVVGMLWDLTENRLIDTIAKTNPQGRYGADVISRITYSSQSEENRNQLQTLILDCFNEMLDAFSVQYQIENNLFRKATVVGNTTMSHLFLGYGPASLAVAPFEPAFTGPVSRTAEEMGLHMDPVAEIAVIPNIAGHVGSDIVGVMLASDLKHKPGITLAIDIGTNGEILLGGKGHMLTCSTAAGPAFEGARIYHGMRAADGAIERVEIRNGELNLKVIGNKPPIGICGSGLIDAIAQMLDAGIISFKGNLLSYEDAVGNGLSPGLTERLRKGENGNEFVLARRDEDEDIVINQKDIREVQLAKGAILAGALILLRDLGATSADLDEILLAGAFGSYIDKRNALRIGLLPNVGLEKVRYIGNAAGVGACMALLSKEAKSQSEQQSREVEHVELALHPNFEKEYLQGMYFPKESI